MKLKCVDSEKRQSLRKEDQNGHHIHEVFSPCLEWLWNEWGGAYEPYNQATYDADDDQCNY